MTDKTVVEKTVTETTVTSAVVTDKAEKKDKKHRKPLTAEFHEMVRVIREGGTADATGALGETKEGGAFAALLPGKMTIDDANAYEEHKVMFRDAGAMAYGQMSHGAMIENGNLTKCAGNLKMTDFDHAEYVVHRSAEHLDPHTKTMVQKPGHVDVKYVVAAGKKSAALKKVKNELASLFTDSMK